MGIEDDVRAAGERLRDERDRAAEAVSNVLGRFADEAAGPAFAHLRRHHPILQAGPVTVVTLAEDVRAVLGDPEHFPVGLYGPKMEAITGPFILGVDDTPLYRHNHAAMDAAVRREDLPGLGDAMLAHGRQLVAAAGDEIDVVSQLADPALDHAVATYFGTPGPDTPTQLRWARSIFWELFINVGNLAETRERALACAAEMRPHVDALVDARKAAIAAGEHVPDDVLTRLLRAQGHAPSLHDVAIRHNIIGNVVGWIPTVSKALALAIAELLEREDELERAQQAAREGDRELVAAYVWEALRFRPQNFALLRECGADVTIAAGTERATDVKAGEIVVAATLSAMHDDRVVQEPEEFRAGRPWSDYMHFGHGLHTCYGRHIVGVQLPALATALLEGPSIRCARGRDGRLRWDGPFPSGLTVSLDRG